jgi:glycosyltransferase involved in cell wall biosynthesis
VSERRPLVSIGVPVYNGERSIHQALDALRAQTYDNLELVISDNASTDSTAEICREYAAQDRRIKYFCNPVNVGLYENFRRVVSLATGEYFMWAAADDLKPPTAVEHCVQAILRNDRAVTAHGIVLIRTADGKESAEYPNEISLTDTSAAARIRNFTYGLRHHAMFFCLHRRAALMQARLGNHVGQDYLLCLQMCLLGAIEYAPVPVIIYQERRRRPSTNVMYDEVPMTMSHLVTANKIYRRKCWTVLILGCYYLATTGQVPWSERWRAIGAHVTAFGSLYRSRFAREILYQLFEPVLWLSILAWRIAHQSSVTLRLARKVQARMMSIY